MSAGRARLDAVPSEETPSAEVLDELLQAFSIDVTDRARFDEIDLTSPEVERLLTPTETPNPAVEVEDENRDPVVEVEGDPTERQSAEPPPSRAKVVITDESLPDAVYVKGSLTADTSGERSTVFIDGSPSTGETISIEDAAAATRIEPRLRDRRIAVRKEAGRNMPRNAERD